MDSQVAKTNQSLTLAEEMRNQTKLIMQPYANWEQYLTPAPLSIAIMGELAFISSKTDFSINKNPPKDGYKYIRYPDSFHACLMQVCNSGWGAFNEAHKNMDEIRLHTMTVPDNMKTTINILFQDNEQVVQLLLPNQLKSISVIADNCLELANATEKRFADVINIIHELLEACVNAKHIYGEELNDIKKTLEESKLRQQSSEKTLKESEKAVKDMEAGLQNAQGNFNKALDSQSSGSGWTWFVETVKGLNKVRIEKSAAQLEKSREAYLQSVEKMGKNQKELTDILVTMRNCNIKEIDFNTTIQMLVKGMDAMGKVKEQWDKMVFFFQMVSKIVKVTMTKTLEDFVSTSTATQALDKDSKLIVKDMLYKQAFQATSMASLVNIISTTYTEVSTKYLMDHVSSLEKLMAMDPEKPEFISERKQLEESCDEAQKAILRLVLTNKEEYEREIGAKLENTDKDLLAILPAAAP